MSDETRVNMIQIACNDPLYTYDVYHLVKAFFPAAEIGQSVDAMQESLVEIQLESGSCFFVKRAEAEHCLSKRDKKRLIGKKLYIWISGQTNKNLPWGMLTGIRPTKLIISQLEQKRSPAEIKEYLATEYFVSEEKIGLGIKIAQTEQKLLKQLDYENGYSLYIGIPFCPSTCSYCSFTSYPLAAWKHRVSA